MNFVFYPKRSDPNGNLVWSLQGPGAKFGTSALEQDQESMLSDRRATGFDTEWIVLGD